MGADVGNDWPSSMASALEWWRDAGVDVLVDDEPHDWLARPAPKREAVATEAAVASAPAEALPDTLEAFVAWRLGDAAPEAGWLTPRIAPAGPAGATMVLIDMPEADDGDSLLAGAPGKLLDRMLAAIGESRDSTYLASLAVARPLTGQIPAEAEPRLAELAAHHVALVAPKRLLLLGQAVKRVFATTNGSGDGNSGRDINLIGGSLEIVASYSPRFLMERPAAKAEAWKHLLRLSPGSSQ